MAFAETLKATEEAIYDIRCKNLRCIMDGSCEADLYFISTSCKHAFCRPCVDRILITGSQCPLCFSLCLPKDVRKFRKASEIRNHLLEFKRCIFALNSTKVDSSNLNATLEILDLDENRRTVKQFLEDERKSDESEDEIETEAETEKLTDEHMGGMNNIDHYPIELFRNTESLQKKTEELVKMNEKFPENIDKIVNENGISPKNIGLHSSEFSKQVEIFPKHTVSVPLEMLKETEITPISINSMQRMTNIDILPVDTNPQSNHVHLFSFIHSSQDDAQNPPPFSNSIIDQNGPNISADQDNLEFNIDSVQLTVKIPSKTFENRDCRSFLLTKTTNKTDDQNLRRVSAPEMKCRNEEPMNYLKWKLFNDSDEDEKQSRKKSTSNKVKSGKNTKRSISDEQANSSLNSKSHQIEASSLHQACINGDLAQTKDLLQVATRQQSLISFK